MITGPSMPVAWRNRRGSVRVGTSDPMPTTTPGTVSLPDTALISARSSCELYMSARTERKLAPKMRSPSAGSRSAVGTSTARGPVTRMP